MSKRLALLSSTAPLPVVPVSSPPKPQAAAKASASVPQQPGRAPHRQRHRVGVAHDGDSDADGGEGDEPDALIPDKIVCGEFNISAMTLWRWDHDPELVALGLPLPITIRRRKFRSRRGLEAFKKEMLKKALRERGAAKGLPLKSPSALLGGGDSDA